MAPYALAIAVAAAIAPIPAKAADTGQVIDAEYRCQSGQTILARYDNTDPNAPRARLTIEGKEFDLHQVLSASGARYATEQGLKPDMGLQWWIKGDEATLSEMLLDHTAPEPTPIDTCAAKAN